MTTFCNRPKAYTLLSIVFTPCSTLNPLDKAEKMPSTIDLLNKALQKRTAAQWCRHMNLARTTLSVAKVRGRLSPTLAGNLAMEIGQNPIYWAAVAAAEAEPPGPLREKLEQVLERHKTMA